MEEKTEKKINSCFEANFVSLEIHRKLAFVNIYEIIFFRKKKVAFIQKLFYVALTLLQLAPYNLSPNICPSSRTSLFVEDLQL